MNSTVHNPAFSRNGMAVHRRKGFTLIEFLVVFSIVTLVIPSLFGLTYTLIRQQGRVLALQAVKRQGDLVLNHMKTSIRNNALGTYNGTLASPNAICTTGASSSSNNTNVYFQQAELSSSYFGYSTTIDGATGKRVLQYETTGSTAIPLTNTAVTIENVSFSCSRASDFGTPVITATYTVTEPINTVSLTYRTTVALRPH